MVGYDLKKAQKNAARIGYSVKPSTKKDKKLDVLKNNKIVASIGAKGYDDFTKHKDQQRRKAFKNRFERYRHIKGSAAWFSDTILWN